MVVFLSYSHQDIERATALRRELEELTGSVWFDRGLTGGQVWWNEILTQLRGCHLFVLALSENSLRSEACLAELTYAVALRRPLLAVRVEAIELSAAPESVRRTQVIDFIASTVDSTRALAKAVLQVEHPDPLPDPLPDPPPMPLSYRDRFAAVFAPTLTLDEQVSLVARLRFDLENRRNVDDAKALLRSLYERADLAWKLRDEIGTLVGEASRPTTLWTAQRKRHRFLTSEQVYLSHGDKRIALKIGLRDTEYQYRIDLDGKRVAEGSVEDMTNVECDFEAVALDVQHRFRVTFCVRPSSHYVDITSLSIDGVDIEIEGIQTR